MHQWTNYLVAQWNCFMETHYNDAIMGAIASQIIRLTIVYSIVYSDADQRKHQSSASLAFMWGIHRGPVNSPHKWPVTRKMFPFDDVIMCTLTPNTQIGSFCWHSFTKHVSSCRRSPLIQHIEAETNARHFADNIFKCISLNENV